MADGNYQIFSLKDSVDTSRQWKGVEWLRANAGYDLGLGLTAEADFCHGIELALGADLEAEAQAALSVFMRLAGNLQLEAAAGANVQAQLKTDLFDEFGLLANLGAYAKAQAAAGLEIGLEIDQLMQLFDEEVASRMDPAEAVLAKRIFVDFLNHIDVQAGAWANASFSAMAQGYCNVYGTFANPRRSGFFIEAGGGIGLEAGCGFDFFAAGRFKSPGLFFKSVAMDLAPYLRMKLDLEYPQYAPQVKTATVALLAVGSLAYVGWQIHDAWHGAHNEEAAKKAVNALFDSYRIMILQAIKANISTINKSVIHAVVDAVLASERYDHDQKAAIEASLLDIVERIESEKLDDFAAIHSLVTDAANIMDQLRPEERETLREPLTILWCSVALLHALRGKEPEKNLHESDLDLPTAPALVLAELFVALGMEEPPSKISVVMAVDYLATRPLHETLPDDLSDAWRPIMTTMREKLHVTGGELVSALLYGRIGGNLTDTRLYGHLRDALKAFLENSERDLLGQTGLMASDDPVVKEYMRYTVLPSLRMANGFLLGQIDRLVANDGAFDADRFRQGLSLLFYRIVAKTLLTFALMLQKRVDDEIDRALDGLIEKVQEERETPLLDLASELAESLSAGLLGQEGFEEATKRMLVDLFTLAKRLHGNRMWTQARRSQRRQLLEAVLVGNDMLPRFFESPSVEAYIEWVMACNMVPNAQALEALNRLYIEVMADQAKLLLEKLPAILSAYLLTLSTEAFTQAQERLEERAEELRSAVAVLLAALERLRQELEAIEAQLRARLEELSDELEWLETHLNSERLLDEAIRAIHDLGIALIQQTVTNPIARWAATSSYEADWTGASLLLRPAVAAGLTLIKDPVKEAIGLVRAAVDGALEADATLSQLKITLIAEIESAISEQCAPIAGVLPEWLSPQNIAETVSSLLMNDLAAFDGAIQKESEMAATRQARDAQDASMASKRQRLDNAMRRIEPAILSPVDATRRHPFVHAKEVDLAVFIEHGTLAMLERDETERIILRLNGKKLVIRRSDWREVDRGILFEKRLRYPQGGLKAGLNVVECSVTNAEPLRHEPRIRHNRMKETTHEEKNRRSVAFYLDPTVSKTMGLQVDASKSRFDVPGKNDHRHTEEEYVTFTNLGDTTLDIGGWTLSDAKEHLFLFPEGTVVEPGASVRIVTGEGTPGASEFYIGRRAAIWNNRGDTVLLIDDKGVLHSSFVYG
ncbi:lamin tail domain-containing protein [Hydrogenimonas sp.]